MKTCGVSNDKMSHLDALTVAQWSVKIFDQSSAFTASLDNEIQSSAWWLRAVKTINNPFMPQSTQHLITGYQGKNKINFQLVYKLSHKSKIKYFISKAITKKQNNYLPN